MSRSEANGMALRCRGWRQEGLLRLLENVLTVAEDPERLVVYAALGKAARNRPAYEAIVRALRDLAEGETLIVQSGKPIAVLTTHARAPLVLMANCNLVGRWANEEVFYDLEQRGASSAEEAKSHEKRAAAAIRIGSQGAAASAVPIRDPRARGGAPQRPGSALVAGSFSSPRQALAVAAGNPRNRAPPPCSAPPASWSRSTASERPSVTNRAPSMPSRHRSPWRLPSPASSARWRSSAPGRCARSSPTRLMWSPRLPRATAARPGHRHRVRPRRMICSLDTCLRAIHPRRRGPRARGGSRQRLHRRRHPLDRRVHVDAMLTLKDAAAK